MLKVIAFGDQANPAALAVKLIPSGFSRPTSIRESGSLRAVTSARAIIPRSPQVNKQNVDRLGFAWDYDTHTNRGLEATPIVVDGVMYTSGSTRKAYALDAKTGKEIWSFDPHADLRVNRESCCDEVNRGVAVWKGKVYVASFDGKLFALDAAPAP